MRRELNAKETQLINSLNGLAGKTVQEIQHNPGYCTVTVVLTDGSTLDIHAEECGFFDVEVLPRQETPTEPVLKLEEQNFMVVTDGDLERFLMKVYNLSKRPEIQAMQEYNNDQDDVFNVWKEELTKWDVERLVIFQSTGYVSYGLHTILIDLCNRGLIKEGRYLLRIGG